METFVQNVAASLSKPLFSVSGQEVTVGQLLVVPVVIIVGLILLRWLGRVIATRLAARHMSADATQLISRAVYIVGVAVLIITALELLNVPLTAFAFISGAIAIGVGFGAQNIINNFISGWILMWERPIRIGDFLEVGDTKGTVERINTRSTRIRRVDGVHLLIPNSYLLENTVVNWTLVDRLARSVIRVGVAYGSPVEQVRDLIEAATKAEESVLAEPAPSVIFEDFGDNALIFDVYYWIEANADRDLRKIRSSIRFRINALFRDNGIVIAFPQRDVHVDGMLRFESLNPAPHAEDRQNPDASPQHDSAHQPE
ncbi:MAG TPA: mechanosensitive ion channel protein [Porticoccaceae bacterium]|nr:mechanosensitive ion channel protein [Porticoccaceae bacterium]HCO61615.1 mechanosensitive ion channel protein [Porticoccaceae bacterium]